MILRHLHLPRATSYTHGSRVQELLVSLFLDAKRASAPLPPPTVITAEFTPTYTLGRREADSLSPAQSRHLARDGRAAVHYALRGGQTTYHGPGQLVSYPIIDLRTHSLTPRNYICLLEKALISVLGKFGVKGITTENTGVWMEDGKSKIASIGVHMRRNVTSHGVALNVTNEPLEWFDRIVACGLPEAKATSLEAQMSRRLEVRETSDEWARELSERLGCWQVQTLKQEDILPAKPTGPTGAV